MLIPTPVNVQIDATRFQPISPYIYGANHPEWEQYPVRFPLARQGGNRMSAYNWENNASNAGSDYRHQNDAYLGATDEPGWTARTFLEKAQKNGAATILTVPTIGYVSADKKGDGDVNQTPDYLNVRFHKSLPRKPGPFTYPPDLTDKAVYQDEFAAWIEKIRSKATPVWFSLDNEPDLWGHTHERLWPKNPTYAQIIANNIEYAAALKRAVPTALIFGPANYGWNGFRTFQNAPDANGRDFLDAYLAALRDAEKREGRRLLDVLDVHFYPEARGDGVRICFGKDKPGTPAARIQAPRSLWDPTYVEDSWITQSRGGKPIALLPGLQAQIARQYPGTKLAISEYDYGGEKGISGALAQADVLGAYGRYGLFAACHWGIRPQSVGIVAGFRAFLNFDGRGARFGDRALTVRGETPEADSVYAARDSRDAKRLTVVAINKTDKPRSMRVTVSGLRPATARAFVVAANDGSLERSTPSTATVQPDGALTFVAPPLSVAAIDVRAR